jgi:hypothetical protein
MDVRYFIAESFAFTRATLWERPSRWLIFILLGLPWTILLSLAESSRIIEGTVIHWSLIPWREAGLLIVTGILCNLLVTGWIVRLLRDNPEPPGFDRPALLCLDGIKASTIPLVWIFVPSVLAYVQFLIAGDDTVTINLQHPDPAAVLILALLAVQVLIVFIAVQYAMIGAIRFARTGSVREGLAVVEIKRTLDRIGIINYFIALAIVSIVWFLFSLTLRGVALMPVAGPAISLALSPVPTVYCFRFMAHFCDEERWSGKERQEDNRDVPAPLSSSALLKEYLIWLPVLGALVVLCFTPMVLMAGLFFRFLP